MKKIAEKNTSPLHNHAIRFLQRSALLFLAFTIFTVPAAAQSLHILFSGNVMGKIDPCG